jgi:cytochrome b561
MTSRLPSSRFSGWSIALHWLMAALLVATAATMELRGMYPKGSDARDLLKTAHYTLGVAVFALVWLRLLARALQVTPPITPTPPAWQAMMGRAMHVALYALMIGLPLLGWLTLSAKGAPIALLGGLQLPSILAENRDTSRWLKELHEAGATAGYALVALHAAAALLHHYVVRDNTLLRMLPGRR